MALLLWLFGTSRLPFLSPAGHNVTCVPLAKSPGDAALLAAQGSPLTALPWWVGNSHLLGRWLGLLPALRFYLPFPDVEFGGEHTP